mmetsp:Transcript_46484/g.110485  ORF Transcript_46484/g.110485 Transcript_46484/m.110485 type:complete len:330 (-) Transcript_46484:341-1330(-)
MLGMLGLLGILQPPLLHHLRQLLLGAPDQQGHHHHGQDPVDEVREDLHWGGLILPAEERAHQHEEAVGLVVAALRGVPDLLVLPGPLGPGAPGPKGVQLLQHVHGGSEEPRSNEEQQNGGEAHEPVHPHVLGSLEEAAAHQARQHQSRDQGQRQAAEVLEVGHHPHQEHNGLQALPEPSGEGQHEKGVLPPELHLLPAFRLTRSLQRLLHLLLHLPLVRLLGVDHLVEVHRQEGEHQAGDHHHAELEDQLVVSLEELEGQGCQCQKSHAEDQANAEAQARAEVDLAPEAVELLVLHQPVLAHLVQELHDDGQHDDHLQALPEENHKGRH